MTSSIAFDRATRLLRGRLIAPYQTSGLRWMVYREKSVGDDIRGGLLADEMGLGKTVMTIATVLSNPSALPTLIIAPKSLVKQWCSEFARFSGIHPIELTSSAINSGRAKVDDIMRAGVVITTYSALGGLGRKPDNAVENNALFRARFHRVILDEAHAIKNAKSKVHLNVLLLQADIKWCLTGTPVTRKKSDFNHIVKFLGIPGGDVHELCRKYMMRRTIDDISKISERLRLPPCDVKLHTVAFTDQERRMYDDLKDEGRMRLNAFESVRDTANNNMGHIVEVILRLRQMCVDPEMVFDGRDEETDAAWDGTRSKIEALVELMSAQAIETKTIVFTHWNGEAEGVVEALQDRLFMKVGRLCGSMNSDAREKTVRDFNEGDTNALVCQIEVGGVGLNLQAATHVYINSPAWNASSELQAIGRAHRTGVKHRVSVTRLVVEDTVEEYIHTLQKDKLGHAAEVLSDQRILGKLAGGKPSLKEMRKIFA